MAALKTHPDIVVEVSGTQKVGKSTIAKEIQRALGYLGISATIEDDSTWAHTSGDSARFSRLEALAQRAPWIVIRSRVPSASKPNKRQRERLDGIRQARKKLGV